MAQPVRVCWDSVTIPEGNFFASFIGTLIWTFVGWVIWSAVTYFVGTSLFGGEADMGEMLRVIGFASAPQILGIIPCIGWIVGAIWALVRRVHRCAPGARPG